MGGLLASTPPLFPILFLKEKKNVKNSALGDDLYFLFVTEKVCFFTCIVCCTTTPPFPSS